MFDWRSIRTVTSDPKAAPGAPTFEFQFLLLIGLGCRVVGAPPLTESEDD
jgi:hypothetical protein